MTMLDCRTCGACCTPGRCSVPDCGCQPPNYAYVAPDDLVRLPLVYQQRHLHQSSDVGAHLATKETRDGMVCVALRGRIGGAVSCTIYDQRPDVCRAFEPGSSLCLGAREEAGLATAWSGS